MKVRPFQQSPDFACKSRTSLRNSVLNHLILDLAGLNWKLGALHPNTLSMVCVYDPLSHILAKGFQYI